MKKIIKTIFISGMAVVINYLINLFFDLIYYRNTWYVKRMAL